MKIVDKANALGLFAKDATPNSRQLEWYSRERMMFIHFGMNTFTDKEWGDGTEDPAIFNPSQLDCRQWIRAVKAAGFRSALLTAKHHDGFCLWPSKYTEHSIKNSPYKNGKGDIVREFTDACREYGIKAGIYLSPWDRNEATWGTEAYNDYYANQLTELMTNYGTIWECWWDGAGSTQAHYDWDRWANIVRTLQPNAVIFVSLGATAHVDVRWVGNEKGIAGKPGWATIDPISLIVETTSELKSGKLHGERFIPAEVDVESLSEFSDALTRFTSVNYADGATVTASSVRSEECAPSVALTEASLTSMLRPMPIPSASSYSILEVPLNLTRSPSPRLLSSRIG